MNPVRAGTAIALVVAGWPLYGMVTSGDMTAENALLRGGIVVVACIYGVTLVLRLVTRYEEEVEAERRKRLDQLFTDMEGAVTDGTLTTPTDPADATAPPGPPAPPSS